MRIQVGVIPAAIPDRIAFNCSCWASSIAQSTVLTKQGLGVRVSRPVPYQLMDAVACSGKTRETVRAGQRTHFGHRKWPGDTQVPTSPYRHVRRGNPRCQTECQGQYLVYPPISHATQSARQGLVRWRRTRLTPVGDCHRATVLRFRGRPTGVQEHKNVPAFLL